MVFGGGGIVPDVLAGDTLLDPREAALNALLAGSAPAFRGALTDVANTARSGRLVQSQDFQITPELLEMLYRRLQNRGIDIPRVVYDDAQIVASRLLAYEIARVIFGPDAEFRRRAADDTALRAALRLASGATSPRDPFRRIAGSPRDQLPDPSG